jgi:hypothetical protein
MNLKSLNRDRILKQILPSLFFIVCVVLYIGNGRGLTFNIIFTGIGLLFLGNVFLQNIIISRILGIIFLLGSLYMTLALFDDIVDGEATLKGGYWVGLLLFGISIIMSILLIVGYRKSNLQKLND